MYPWGFCLILYVQFEVIKTQNPQNTSTSSNRSSPEITSSLFTRPAGDSTTSNVISFQEKEYISFLIASTESTNVTSLIDHGSTILPLVLNPNSTNSELLTKPNRDFLTWIYGIFNGENFNSSQGIGSDNNKLPENCPKCSCGVTNVMQRIVGGVVTKIKLYPWIVALANKNRFFCGASAINSRYVLTAAHCTIGIAKESISATFMEHDRSDPSETKTFKKKIISILRHKLYQSGGNYDYDIALLKLEDHIQLVGEMRPICLPTIGRSFSGMIGKVLGWGATHEYGSVSSKLREVDVRIISNEDCRKTKYGDKITGNMICAGYPNEGGKDACQGDSGGPLQVANATKNMIVGIVSWGEGCALKNYPGVYARVNKFVTWIRANTKDACYC